MEKEVCIIITEKRGSMIREVLEMVPSFYSPSEITKGQLENKIAELKEVLQSIERKL